LRDWNGCSGFLFFERGLSSFSFSFPVEFEFVFGRLSSIDRCNLSDLSRFFSFLGFLISEIVKYSPFPSSLLS